jgi:hypothetical protein
VYPRYLEFTKTDFIYVSAYASVGRCGGVGHLAQIIAAEPIRTLVEYSRDKKCSEAPPEQQRTPLLVDQCLPVKLSGEALLAHPGTARRPALGASSAVIEKTCDLIAITGLPNREGDGDASPREPPLTSATWQ